jgi:hypothetical protein
MWSKRAKNLIFLRLFLCAALGLSFAGLAGCSGKTYPFGKGRKAMSKVITQTPPPIYLAAMRGLPRDKADRLFAYLSHEAARRNLRFTTEPRRRSFRLSGHFSAARSGRRATVVYVWDINRNGHRLSGQQNAASPTGSGLWQGLDDRMMAQIARETAEGLSGWLGKLGYRVTAAPLPPPPRHTAVPPHPAPVPQLVAAPLPPPSPQRHASARPRPAPLGLSPAYRQAPRTIAPARADTFRIHVRRLAGTAPTAALILSQSLQSRLARAGFHLAATGYDAHVIVSGAVGAGPRTGRRIPVTVSWFVHNRRGDELGTITQTNRIHHERFGNDWGGKARLAGLAAADAIAGIIRKRH